MSFRVKNYYNDGTRRILTLDTGGCIRRYLSHVLAKGLMRVRHYDSLAIRCRRRYLLKIRTALGAITSPKNQPAPDASISVSVFILAAISNWSERVPRVSRGIYMPATELRLIE